MTQQETSLESLLSVTAAAGVEVTSTDLDREFLLSFKQNSPDWSRYRYPEIQHLPAIRWKQATHWRCLKIKSGEVCGGGE